MSGLDLLIAFTVILFLLSVLAEKFSQLIRQQTRAFAILIFLIGVYCGFGLFREGFTYICGLSKPINGLGFSNVVVIVSLIIHYVVLGFFCFKRLKVSTQELNYKQYIIFGGPVVAILLFRWLNLISIDLGLYLYSFLSITLLYFSAVALKLICPLNAKISNDLFEIRLFQKIKKGTISDETGKEQEITLLTILVGIFIAFCFNINMLELLKDLSDGKNTLNFGWDNDFPFIFENYRFRFEEYEFDSQYALGLLLIGFFLSFGSKFFHDLLDQLYLAKKVKQASHSPELLKQNSTQALWGHVESFDADKFYKKRAKSLVDKELVTGLGVGTVIENNRLHKGIKVFNAGPTLNPEFMQELFVGRDRDKLSRIPIEIISDSDNEPAELTSISMSDAIFNESTGDASGGGQITFPVINTLDPGNDYFLSCYHVVKHPSHSWNNFVPGLANSHVAYRSGRIGEIVRAKRTAYYEVALIKQKAGLGFSTPFPLALQGVKDSRNIEETDEGLEVYAYSRKGDSKITGRILTPDCIYPIKFDGSKYTMEGLICIKGPKGHIQQPGDSGGLIIDKNGFAIGILFARKYQKFSFAMPLQKVLNEFNLTLKI